MAVRKVRYLCEETLSCRVQRMCLLPVPAALTETPPSFSRRHLTPCRGTHELLCHQTVTRPRADPSLPRRQIRFSAQWVLMKIRKGRLCCQLPVQDSDSELCRHRNTSSLFFSPLTEQNKNILPRFPTLFTLLPLLMFTQLNLLGFQRQSYM